VFITGESGTGKEVVAQTLHDLSARRNKPLLAINCGAISPLLIESEIFGHEKGSFTGADRQHQGFFEQACGSTLFLDEVTEMPLDLQVKLLRVLETGRFTRVGSTQSQVADVRIIAASNRCPFQAVAQGRFREDLLYRLNVFPLALPPLRERLEDVPQLARHFLKAISAAEGEEKHLSTAALEQLSRHQWPGNVRELRNAIQRAYVMTPGMWLDGEWLPGNISGSLESLLPDEIPLTGTNAPAMADARSEHLGTALDEDSLNLHVGMSMAQAERLIIEATLKQCKYHKERTAAVLGISLKTLYNRLKSYADENLSKREWGSSS
jgi:DNA-binding NtrC family response regulator